MRRLMKWLILPAVMLVWAPLEARADGYGNFWVGRQSGNTSVQGRAALGITAGSMGAGVVGSELDFGYSPSYFGTENEFGHNTLIDLTLNVVIGVPIGNARGAGVRPFVRMGAGLIRTQIDGGTVFNVSSSENHIGWDLGGGVMGFMSDHVGLRGDVTYFRNMNGNVVNGLDLGGLHFWRMSVGLLLR